MSVVASCAVQIENAYLDDDGGAVVAELSPSSSTLLQTNARIRDSTKSQCPTNAPWNDLLRIAFNRNDSDDDDEVYTPILFYRHSPSHKFHAPTVKYIRRRYSVGNVILSIRKLVIVIQISNS